MATITIAANGDHYIPLELLPANRAFEIGAKKVGAGATATIQLWGEIAGVKTNLDSAVSVTNASPQVWPNNYTPNPKRGVTVSGLNETDDVLTLEIQ